jgi:dienelactone hydrolase
LIGHCVRFNLDQAALHLCVVPSRRRFKFSPPARQKLNKIDNAVGWVLGNPAFAARPRASGSTGLSAATIATLLSLSIQPELEAAVVCLGTQCVVWLMDVINLQQAKI